MKGQVYNKCSYSYTPATENPVCNQLFEWAKKNKLWSKRILTRKQLPQDTSVRVYYWNEMVDKAAYTTCYRSRNLHFNLYIFSSSDGYKFITLQPFIKLRALDATARRSPALPN